MDNKYYSEERQKFHEAVENLKEELFKLKIVSFIYKILDWLEDKLSKII